jgi:hypothetical protein
MIRVADIRRYLGRFPNRDHADRFICSFSAVTARRFPPPWTVEELLS